MNKISQEHLTVLCRNRLGVELYSKSRKLSVPDTHDNIVVGPGCNIENTGGGVAFDDERMITSCGKPIGNSCEDPLPIVIDCRDFYMDDGRCLDNRSAEGLADRLMSQTYPKNRNRRVESGDEINADAGFIRSAWSWGDHDVVGLQCRDLLDRHCVVPHDANLGAKLSEVLHQVEGEGIVIVDEKCHNGLLLQTKFVDR